MDATEMEQKIDDILEYVKSCKTPHLSPMKAIVPKQELYDQLDMLRDSIPDSVRKYERVLKQREQIIENAKEKAEAILEEAREKYKTLVEEHTIVQQAYQQAELTKQAAQEEADRILEDARKQEEDLKRMGLMCVSDMLSDSDQMLSKAYESIISNARSLESAMHTHLDMIRERNEQVRDAIDPQQEIKVDESLQSGKQQEKTPEQNNPEKPEE